MFALRPKRTLTVTEYEPRSARAYDSLNTLAFTITRGYAQFDSSPPQAKGLFAVFR